MARRTRQQILSDYYKERRSILNRRRYISKKYGVELQDITLPRIPEKITAKSIEQLQKARTVIEKTTIQRSIEKGIQSKSTERFLPEFTSVALYRFKEEVLTNIEGLGAMKIYKWLMEIMEKFSEREVSKVLARAQADGVVPEWKTYAYEMRAMEYIRDLMPYFMEIDRFNAEDIDDRLEEITYLDQSDELLKELGRKMIK